MTSVSKFKLCARLPFSSNPKFDIINRRNENIEQNIVCNIVFFEIPDGWWIASPKPSLDQITTRFFSFEVAHDEIRDQLIQHTVTTSTRDATRT